MTDACGCSEGPRREKAPRAQNQELTLKTIFAPCPQILGVKCIVCER
jgi:hypothetical protein